MRIGFATAVIVLVLALVAAPLPVAAAGGNALTGEPLPAAVPDAATARELVGAAGPVTVTREDGAVPGYTVRGSGGEIAGYIGSTWEISGSVGYSGRPLDVLVAIDPAGTISGARLVRHEEPVLTLGISTEDIARYVGGFKGANLAATREEMTAARDSLPDVISRATVSTGVIRDGILRTARALAIGRRIIAPGDGIDRITYRQLDWEGVLATGALAHVRMSLSEARAALAQGKNPPPEGDGAFLDLYAGIIDPPTVGRSLLGQRRFTEAVATLGPADAALMLMSSGLHSPRGTEWTRTGVFDRIAIIQDDVRIVPTRADYMYVKMLAAAGAPEFREIGVYRIGADGFDPARPFRVEVTAARPTASGKPVKTVIAAGYTMPGACRVAAVPEPEALWRSIWERKVPAIAITATMLVVLTLILFAQDGIVRRPRLWRGLRLGFLLTTFLVLGMGLNGQLSVVQVVAFLHSLLTGFRWETFLVEPVIFMLWSFTALGMLFWGRGVYCGWLCPFGALQELLNAAAQRLGMKQLAVPQALHERLWVIKYTLFLAILALSFYSMHDALVLAEAEPFKTAISLRMMRAWPFVLYVLALLAAGLFIERFYCRYLCPLGAGIAIPAKLKIFDWLKRRPQCGRECRLCETKCTVGAIDPLGRINANECVLCLRCQVVMNDPGICPVLKRRARASEGAAQ